MPKKSIPQLFAEFERAVVAMDAVPVAKSVPFKGTKEFNRAVDACVRLAKRIVVLPAADVGEMLIKIKVAGWSGEARPLDQLENWKPTRFARGEVFDCLVSLRADLRRMQAAPPRRALRRPERVEAAPSR
jgi:hypothetical protein